MVTVQQLKVIFQIAVILVHPLWQTVWASDRVFHWRDDQGVAQFSQFKPFNKKSVTSFTAGGPQIIVTHPTSLALNPESKPTKIKSRKKLKPKRKDRKNCDQLRDDIKKIGAKMRSGYGAKEEKRLRTQRRQLEKAFYYHCVR